MSVLHVHIANDRAHAEELLIEVARVGEVAVHLGNPNAYGDDIVDAFATREVDGDRIDHIVIAEEDVPAVVSLIASAHLSNDDDRSIAPFSVQIHGNDSTVLRHFDDLEAITGDILFEVDDGDALSLGQSEADSVS